MDARETAVTLPCSQQVTDVNEFQQHVRHVQCRDRPHDAGSRGVAQGCPAHSGIDYSGGGLALVLSKLSCGTGLRQFDVI